MSPARVRLARPARPVPVRSSREARPGVRPASARVHPITERRAAPQLARRRARPAPPRGVGAGRALVAPIVVPRQDRQASVPWELVRVLVLSVAAAIAILVLLPLAVDAM